MLAGVPKAEVIAAGLAIAKLPASTPWEQFILTQPLEVLHTLQIRYVPNLQLPLATLCRWGSVLPGAVLPSHGRGAILVSYCGKTRHIMPYEDGRVLDPAGPGTYETLDALLTRYGVGWYVESIHPEIAASEALVAPEAQ